MKYKLGDIAKIYNGSTPSTSNKEYWDGDIIWITPKDLSDQHSKYIYKGERNITRKGFEADNLTMLPADSILLTSRAPIGLVSINKVVCCTNQGFKNIVPNKNIVDVEYLYYFLSLHKMDIIRLGSGTTFKEVSRPVLSNLEIDLPDLQTQKQISSILKNIDAKAENNNKINSVLESLAKTIYGYWFLQFDFPNEEGKPYKSSGGAMEYNEQLKMEIPKGWEVAMVTDIADWISNSQPPKSNFIYTQKDGYIRFIQNRDYDSNEYKTYIPMSKTLNIVNRYDILVDKYGDAGSTRYGIEGTYNVALAKIEPHNTNMREYLRSFLSSKGIYTYLHNACMASTRASLDESVLSYVYMPIPPSNLLEKYEGMIHLFREQILTLKDENDELSSLRDYLLPLLMNGQVGFKDE